MSDQEKRKANPLSKLIHQASQNSDSQITALVNARADFNAGKNVILADQTGRISYRVDLIDPNPYQPRKEFDEAKIKELAESIDAIGQIEPIVVRKTSQGRCELIVGERRLRAVKLLGKLEIDVVIQDVSDSHMSIMALAENLDREDLSDFETGMAIVTIQDFFKNKTELAEYFGRTNKDIHRLLAFNSFPQWIKDRLNDNPKLISKTISQSLKAFLESDDYSDEHHQSYVIKAMNMMAEGALTQSMFIEYIKRQITESDKKKIVKDKISSRSYEFKGKEIGKFIYDEKKLTVKLNLSKINEKLAEEIFQMIELKIKNDLN
jgi:ParB family chromosome partitioning protein